MILKASLLKAVHTWKLKTSLHLTSVNLHDVTVEKAFLFLLSCDLTLYNDGTLWLMTNDLWFMTPKLFYIFGAW